MSSNEDNDDMTDDERDSTSTQPTSLVDQLRTLLETLAEIETEEAGNRRGSGQIDRGTSRVDYNYNVSIGLGQSDQSRDTGLSPHQLHSKRQSPQQRATEDSVPIEIREGPSGNELIVIADLLGVTDDDNVDVDLDTDESALILRINENEVERITIDQSELTITDVTINNQVLKICVSHAPDSNGGKTT